MTDEETQTVDILNDLYAAERRSLLPRLTEMNNFLSWVSAADLEVIKGMIAEELEHEAWLIEIIEACGGSVYPVSADLATANLHFLELHTLLPQILDSVRFLADLYDRASATQPSMNAEGTRVVSTISRRHHHHLQELQQLHHRFTGQPA